MRLRETRVSFQRPTITDLGLGPLAFEVVQNPQFFVQLSLIRVFLRHVLKEGQGLFVARVGIEDLAIYMFRLPGKTRLLVLKASLQDLSEVDLHGDTSRWHRAAFLSFFPEADPQGNVGRGDCQTRGS